MHQVSHAGLGDILKITFYQDEEFVYNEETLFITKTSGVHTIRISNQLFVVVFHFHATFSCEIYKYTSETVVP